MTKTTDKGELSRDYAQFQRDKALIDDLLSEEVKTEVLLIGDDLKAIWDAAPGPAPAKYGQLGVHDRYHLSTEEKHKLLAEIKAFAASRFAGEPCPSCLFDVLTGAAYDHAYTVLQDEKLNSGTSADFLDRLPDFSRFFRDLIRVAQRRVDEAVRREKTEPLSPNKYGAPVRYRG